MPETTRIALRRPVGVDDLDAVCELVAACDIAAVGFVDFTRDDMAADLCRDDLETYGWYDDRGTLVAYGWVSRTANSNKVQLDIYQRPDQDPSLGSQVLVFLEERGRSLAADLGHAAPFFDVGVFREDERTRSLLAAAGFEPRTTFTRMRIDLDGPVEVPATDVVVRQVSDLADLRVAHRIEEESFAEHYGTVALPFDVWRRRLDERGRDFAHLFLAEVGGEPAGLLVSTRQFEPDDNAGYVRTLGVLPAARGRGVAKAMLRDCFARARREGRAGVLLHVDVANVTGALRLYESVGMRPVVVIDAWAKGALAPRMDADAPG